MIRILAVILVASLCDLAEAQDLVITNARILDGRGTIIQAGSIAVEAGLIASVSKDASAPGAIEIDARGMTVMPGLIDSHTHLLLKGRRMQSETALSRWISDELPSILADYLAAGVTTVMSHGDFFPEIMEVRRLIDEGELPGPRLLVSGPFLTASNGHPIGMLCDGAPSFCRASLISEIDSPESARAKVRDLGEAPCPSRYHPAHRGAARRAHLLKAIAAWDDTVMECQLSYGVEVKKPCRVVETCGSFQCLPPSMG